MTTTTTMMGVSAAAQLLRLWSRRTTVASFTSSSAALRRRALHASAVAPAAALGDDISTVGVVGLGSMGHGVAQLAAESGYSVVVNDHSQEALDNGLNAIHKSLKFLAGKKVKTGDLDQAAADAHVEEVFSRISGDADLAHVTNNADLIIEAIIENLDVKVPFFETLGATSKPSAILATNTSSFSVSQMAEASGVPHRVVGLHYFNPVQVMKLVEIISTSSTDPRVTEAVVRFVEKTNKTAVHCGDTPGFIVNRLLVPYLGQAIALLARGDANAPDIDTGMMLGAGHPMGPITLADYVGLDVIYYIMQGWIKEHPDDPAFQNQEAMDLLEKMVGEGKLGRKSGQGFFRWNGNKCLGL